MLKHVIENVYLAPPVMRDEDVQRLREAGVHSVVNVGGFDNTWLLEGAGFHFHVSSFQDTGREQPLFVWEELRTFLLAARERGDKIAIHCIGGPRRSASTAYLYLRLLDFSDPQAILILQNTLPGETPIYSGPINDWLGMREAPPSTEGFSSRVIL